MSPSITSHSRGLCLTESLMIHVSTTWKQHMCFVHVHHENTSSIKINFNFTVSLFQHTRKLPFSFQQLSKWEWNKLTMHLKRYNIPKMFSDWIISNNLFTWLAENICRAVPFFFFHYNNTHAMSCCRKWFLFLTSMASLSLFTQTEAATEVCSLKI